MWLCTNPREVYTSQMQFRHKINIRAGILNDHLIRPVYMDGNLSGEQYYALLAGEIADRLAEIEENEGADLGALFYMHDGCPAQNFAPALALLHDTFPGQVIGTHEPIAWPARLPDMNPLDIFCGLTL